ncbi:DPP IV N-terminal domain-containing protein [Nocardioides kongjuensis]|uniref:Dipeptidyl aminopeptidase/acylaminoacyl peptidase n=1 Tax=Nocardioides kongjuensis TaxID=349522 RepID=A0A852RPN0_9ACTN|nr:DPP IV N-terminal domain-containing protein [Nocardioides kongjuensis]NYD31196.1 dipeptidyl aminopeptidase/acylaminoacyl peptidase [Nocardioides kongjuensis]
MLADALPAATYRRAEALLPHRRHRLALRTQVRPHWIADGDRFWYRVETERGGEFVLVDPDAGTRARAFDHERVAAALTAATGEPVAPYDLPFRSIAFTGEDGIAFRAFGGRWVHDLLDGSLTREPEAQAPSAPAATSPDGRWAAFVRDHDVWIRSSSTGEEVRLTTDGTDDQPYATQPDYAQPRQLLRLLDVPATAPALVWSPDSTRLLTHRVDQRDLPLMHLVESAPPDAGRPRLHSCRYPVAGEPMARGSWVVLDVARRQVVEVAMDPFQVEYLTPLAHSWAWWADDASAIHVVDRSDDLRSMRLCRVDPTTGATRDLVTESAATRIEPNQHDGAPPLVRVLADGHEVVWYSQRDGWGHLYLYADGVLVRQLTSGAWAVQEIAHVDETARAAYVVVTGMVADDPYRRSLLRVDLDGGAPARLTDDRDHAVAVAPHGRWFVDTASTVDSAPETVVRGTDGALLLELEQADLGPLRALGWSPPERFRALAADGRTPLYGLLYKPFDLDPTQTYPVVDHDYPGPQVHVARAGFDQGAFGADSEAVAALGMAVLVVDGRGTPGRDKAFHDQADRNLHTAGFLDDHVAVLRQLAESRPWLDLDRVGIFGRSGGGYAAARALLAHPDVYSVGVAEAGNHDNRMYHASWVEMYDGPYDPSDGARLSNTELAGNLTGRLLLVHGDMDDNVTPHLTMRLVEALIAADKDFDLLIVPGAEHAFTGRQHYVLRKRWDHLVRHLLHREPPHYRLAPIPPDPELVAFFLG